MKTLTLSALIVVLSSSLAWGAPSRDTLEVELSAVESVPGKKALLRHGGGVEKLLHEIVSSPSHRRLARNRALTVLRYYPSKATQALLKKELERNVHQTKGLAIIDMQQALTSYAEVTGPAGIALIKRFLKHVNADLRVSAAEAVRLSRVKNAKALLDGRIKLEKTGFVRHALSQQVKLLSRVKAKTR